MKSLKIAGRLAMTTACIISAALVVLLAISLIYPPGRYDNLGETYERVGDSIQHNAAH